MPWCRYRVGDVVPRESCAGAGVLQLRDFLLVYNRMTELCFRRCVCNLNYRLLTGREVRRDPGSPRAVPGPCSRSFVPDPLIPPSPDSSSRVLEPLVLIRVPPLLHSLCLHPLVPGP